MAALAAQIVVLPEGTELVIRSAEGADASAAMAFQRAASASTDQIMTQPDEVSSDDQAREHFARFIDDPRALALLALVGSEIVGRLGLHPAPRRRGAHVVDLGISVAAEWRGRGVGTALVSVALNWAAAHDAIEMVALCVFSSNPRAEALYRRFGFVRDGVRPKHAQIRPGEYVDDVMMTLFVKPGLAPAGYNTYVGCAERPAAGA